MNQPNRGAPPKCPPECKTELQHIASDIEEIKAMEKTQWEEIAKRPKLGPLLWIAGLSIAVLGGLLGLIYDQNQKTHEDVVDLMLQAKENAVLIENHTERSHDSYHNPRTDTDGG